VLSSGDAARDVLGRTFRAERGRLLAALARRFGAGRLDLVECALQEALARAAEHWPRDGLPASPTGWLLRVAGNVALDDLRRGAPEAPQDETPPRNAAVDDELALIFLCCHDSLPRAAQVALTLNTVCGFTAQQIAVAFLSDARTVAQRIVRAKERLRAERARFEVPAPDELPARLDAILDVLYLVYNEGYNPSDGDVLAGDELCGEALRLSRLLVGSPATATPGAEALAALLCFQASRAAARRADDGGWLLLAEQDRARWDHTSVTEAFSRLERAAVGGALSRFHLEAGIAACHAAAATYQATDWSRIVFLYDVLREHAPSPVVDVNRAIAVAMARGALAGLDELDAIPERSLMSRYPYALSAYAELHASLGHDEEARAYLRRAIEHQPVVHQRSLLERKLRALGSPSSL
jgi:RNA polymerase sigma-70 factor (ECF subfamily)